MFVAVEALQLIVIDDTLHVAMAQAVDLRRSAGLAHQRVVLRRTAVAVQAHDLAEVVAGVLGLLAPVETIAQGQYQSVIRQPGHAPTVMRSTGLSRLCGKQHLHILQLTIDQPRLAQTGVVGLGRAVCIAQIQLLITGELRVKEHLHQPGLGGDKPLRHAANRLRIKAAVLLDDAQAADALGYQHAAIRQEGQRPGMLQAFSHGFDAVIHGMRQAAAKQTKQQQSAGHIQHDSGLLLAEG